ncbi:MAG TPA: hypothetical protein VHO84_12820 [Syntrophorhabdaceae bacterium]|nr:hypothetical protein [Syntrophorhabdaceae bacterium]
MSLRKFMLLVTLFSCLATGCASGISGRDFSFDTVRTFKAGLSTKSDIVKLMGEPSGRFQEENNIESWLYNYIDTRAATGITGVGLTQQGKSATFLFKGEELTNLYWEEFDHRVKGSTSGRFISDDEINALRRGTTTVQEVAVQFGAPYNRRYRPDKSEMWIYVHVNGEFTRTVTMNFKDGVLEKTSTGGSARKK